MDGETNTPLQGANAVIKGTTIGDTDNKEGLIEIKNISNGNQTIIFSYVGFETSEMTYKFLLEVIGALIK